MDLKTTNPFSSCYLKPGANSYLFARQDTVDSIEDYSQQRVVDLVIDFLNSTAKRRCIVGPHGTGKSTLLVQIMDSDLIRRLPHTRVQLSSDSRNFAELWKQQRTFRNGVFALDGYEQLDWFSKLRLLLATRKLRQRLIVTTHAAPIGFKVLHQTSRTQEMDTQIVCRLLRDSPEKAAQLLQSDFWRASYERHAQNLRESLFDAYDWYEQHQ